MDPNAFMMGGGGGAGSGNMLQNQMLQGQMMQGQMMPGSVHQNQMQWPQQITSTEQLYNKVISDISKIPMPAGWQQSLDLRERAGIIMQL